ncbi:MAG: 1-deoxy-D-xylulose-5-phosphate synthase [Pseudomonadota bacterium]|nr:1-deoxy-D-xylulose-5-phosphate synthase [Pseudomonadota bacterium]
MFYTIPTERPETPLLNAVDSPSDLRELTTGQLETLAEELRHFLLFSVGQTGGHFGAGLGVVELTIALHHCLNTPHDHLVWDVGHQTYPHKILTGRRERMHTLRQAGGIAPFPMREESPYDTFGVGHSSTSISAALGMAIAKQAKGDPSRTVAVIGDGAMTAGLAFEALNHAGATNANLLVILNDNAMSISENVGGLSRYFARILSSQFYLSVRESGKRMLKGLPGAKALAKRTEEHMKGMVVPGTLFDELGLNYMGPIDGHDLPALVATLNNIKDLQGPQFLHLVTRKGKGYLPAEESPIGSHSLTKLEASKGQNEKKKSYSNVFGEWLVQQAEKSPELMAITPAMREGSDLIAFSEQFPERYFDVAIAEQHAVTLAAGLACEGMKPVVAIYSTFLQRAYDQVIHDVALQNLDVLFAIDRAGLLEDGPTHSGVFDLSFLRPIPNLLLMTPSDEAELHRMLTTGYLFTGPAAVRYPRGAGPGALLPGELEPMPIGEGVTKREGNGVAILAFGSMVTPALSAAETIDATVADMRFVKPIDVDLILEAAKTHSLLVTVEENAQQGGAGSAVGEVIHEHGIQTPLLRIAIPDAFIDPDKPEAMRKQCALDTESIIAAIDRFQRDH